MIKDGASFPETLDQPEPKGTDINRVENIQFPEVLPTDPQKLGKSSETIDAEIALRNYNPVNTPIIPWNITINLNQTVYLVNASSWPQSVALLSATWTNWTIFVFKKIDATSNKVTITAPWGQTIDWNANLEIDIPMTSVFLVSDGSNYFII